MAKPFAVSQLVEPNLIFLTFERSHFTLGLFKIQISKILNVANRRFMMK